MLRRSYVCAMISTYERKRKTSHGVEGETAVGITAAGL